MANKDNNMIWYAAGGAGLIALLALLFGPQIISQTSNMKGKDAPNTYLANFTKKKGCNCGV